MSRRRRRDGRIHRVFRRQFPQFGIEVQQLAIVPGSQTLDERVIKLLRARMKARRRVGLQAVAHVTVHHGDAPGHAPRRAGVNTECERGDEKMKRLGLVMVCLALIGTLGFAAGKRKVIGYYMDAADDYYKAGFQVFKALATREGWQVLDIVGQGTGPEQMAAVENFITQGVDAIVVIQHSPQVTTSAS